MIRPRPGRDTVRTSPPLAAPARPLVLTTDDALLDDVLRLAAAAGVDVEVVSDPGAARSAWPSASMVVVGDDQADDLAHLAPTRRQGVYLITRQADDPAVWQRGVALGAEHVLFLPADEPWLTDRFADAAEGDCHDAFVIGVIGGRGGAGASVLATALAVTSARRHLDTMLIDLDPLGGGLDLVLGVEGLNGLRWPDLADSRGRLNSHALRDELPGKQGLTVLSWDRGDLLTIPGESIHAVLAAARRSCDTVVLDVPRTLTPATEEAVAACSTTVLIVPTEVRAVAAASRVATRMTLLTSDVRVVTRGTSSSSLKPADVADALALPLLTHMPDERRLTEQLDRGDTPGAKDRSQLSAAADAIIDQLLFERQISS